MPHERRSRTQLIMTLAFAVVGVSVFVVTLVEYAQDVKTNRAVEAIHRHVLISVELAHRIGDDIHSERLLLDRHVFQHEVARMAEIEQRIARLRENYEEATRTYAALGTSPLEAAAWRQLTSDVLEARRRVAPALALSRQDRDDDAIRALEELDPLYEKIMYDEVTLDRINQAAADRAVEDVRRVQVTTLRLRVVLLGIVLGTVALVGAWSTRSALRAQRKLADVNRTLAERNQDLDAFAGRLAHDLRGSLAAISLSSGVLAERFPEARTTTAVVDRSITQIANLIDELLTLSRVGATPNATAQAESIAVALGQRLEPLVAEAGGELHIDLKAGTMACSENLLIQVLWNLGENAVKYRRPNLPASISIEGRVDAGRYLIRVADNGLGMTESDARRVFEPFYRGQHTREIAGTGLGLAIVHRIVEVSHGTVTVDSTLGEGTTFTVSMPLGTRPTVE